MRDRSRLWISGCLVAAFSLMGLDARASARPKLDKAAALEAELRNDTTKLRLRHNLERLVSAWEAAERTGQGAERLEAFEGRVRAWGLLAHWSGRQDDRKQARELEAELEQAKAALAATPSKKTAPPSRAAPEPKDDGKADGADDKGPKAVAPTAQPAVPTLPKLIIEVEDGRAQVVLPVDGKLELVRKEKIGRSGNSPARVYFDLRPLSAAPEALGSIPIEHASVRRVRVGQFDGQTVRFVFELENADMGPDAIEWSRSSSPRFVIQAREAKPNTLAARAKSESAPPRATKGKTDPKPAETAKAVAAPEHRDEDDALADLLDRLPTTAEPEGPTDAKADKEALEQLLERIIPETDAGSEAAGEAAEATAPGTRTPIPAEAPPASTVAPTRLARSTRAALGPRPAGLLKIRRVVIDAGHGGKDAGAVGKRGTKEKDVNLAIAMQLGRELRRQLGIEVIYTRTKDVFISLQRRAKIANRAGADLFISVHANANRSKKIHGIETYYLNTTSNRYSQRLARRENSEAHQAELVSDLEPGEDEEDEVAALPDGQLGRDLRLILADLAMRSASGESRRLAGYIQSTTVGHLRSSYEDVKDLGVKKALFYVLLGVRMPSVLVESGFVTHADEERRLGDRAYQRQLARSIATGVRRYIEERNELASRL